MLNVLKYYYLKKKTSFTSPGKITVYCIFLIWTSMYTKISWNGM